MDVKALGEELERLLDMSMSTEAWDQGAVVMRDSQIRTLSQAILALEAVERMTNPYVSPYADQSQYEWNNGPIQNVVDGDPA